MTTIPPASATLVWSFAALAVTVGAALPIGLLVAARAVPDDSARTRRYALVAAAGVMLWMGGTGAAAAAGVLAFGPLPPPMGLLFVVIVAGALVLARSRVGTALATGLPLWVLVGFHAFRLPLELLMHRAYAEGLMPVQMSYSGWNFDVLTGVSAAVVALLLVAGRIPLQGVRIWNWCGTLLLVNILAIAWLSTPGPLRVFMNEPANVWITQPPFVWLPSVLVFSALVGHLLVFRRLRHEARLRATTAAHRDTVSTVAAGHPR